MAIEGNRQTGHEALLRPFVGRPSRRVALARPDELDLVSALAESLDHETHRPGNTVDLRRIGFGDDGDAERAPRTRLWDGRIHARAQCTRNMNTGLSFS
jgi:hypothetical protein